MPDLIHTLQGNDLGFLKMVADFWGIDFDSPDLAALVIGILNKPLVHEIIESLPTEARSAMETLIENNGKISWQLFTRRFGEVRIMGAGRRDRERPDLNPVSPTEMLWYRGLIGKAFFNLSPEPQEYAYIPDDLFDLLQPVVPIPHQVVGRPASPLESGFETLSNDSILDDTCSLLASLRSGLDLPKSETDLWAVPPYVLVELLQTAGLIDDHAKPRAEAVRNFLESSRAAALFLMVNAWLTAQTFNDLHHLKGLKFEGDWHNNPLHTRQFLLGLIAEIPASTWWNLSAFISGIRQSYPDFQRPAGDYDSWFIYKESEQKYLRGFSSWDEVDGALIEFLITGPLHWLGFLDLASPSAETKPTSFRRSGWFEALASSRPPSQNHPEVVSYQVTSDGQIQITKSSPRSIHYQIARFCIFEKQAKNSYFYRITPESLQKAQGQGLTTNHLIGLLKKSPPAKPVPPGVLQALDRWAKLGVQSKFENGLLLRVNSEEIVSILRKNPRSKRFLGELLNPTTLLINPAGKDVIREVLMEAGYLSLMNL